MRKSTATSSPLPGPAEPSDERPPLTVDEYYAPVPEWVLDAPISDCALRLYAVLLRYGHTSGARIPSRATLAHRLHKTSVDTVDRALRELVTLGAVHVEHRRHDGSNQTNRYHLLTHRPDPGGTDPHRSDAATPTASPPARPAAPAAQALPPEPRCLPAPTAASADVHPDVRPDGRTRAAPTPSGAAPVAAPVRPNPEPFTQTTPPPNPPTPARPDRGPGDGGPGQPDERLAPLEADRATALATRLGLTGLAELHQLAADCRRHRTALGQPNGRWSLRGTLAALHLALERQHPPTLAPEALRAIARDPTTKSPMRLAAAGPWWDQPLCPPPRRTSTENAELAEHERYLADRDDRTPPSPRENPAHHRTATPQPPHRRPPRPPPRHHQ